MENFINTLSAVSTEYVALCDGDDYWTDNNKLQKQVDFLDKHKDYSICFHKTRIFFEDGSRPDLIYPEAFKRTSAFNDLVKESYIPANTVVYRWCFNKKKQLKDIFPKDIVPGDYFVHLLHAEKGKIGFINEVMSSYRRHDKGMWWLTSQVNRQDDFTLKYGAQYVNFFTSVEKHFGLSDDTYKMQKEYITNNIIRCYIENNLFDKLFDFKVNNEDLFNKCINSFNYRNPIYETLSKPKRLLYLLAVNPKMVREKAKKRLVMAKDYLKQKVIKNK